ncbi:hypothetical protein EYZ11_011025 [Aspergillus tanneri]|uniref:Uncharacterized protein n=1 Tax=Aspergillus tanneri TaxID=1220188 RepID=A0A4S3J3U3_9EURO|nr:hypothetical protein EYZ11_011025 [Aspergillus tanneri]
MVEKQKYFDLAYPVRETISHPYAPVPGTSNVDKDANKDLHDKESPKEEVAESSLIKIPRNHENCSSSDEFILTKAE